MRTESLLISPDILQLIASIDEFKGAWKALGNIAPEQLTSLRRVATIESIGSSTRIEGSKLSDREIEKLLSNVAIQKLENRDEQEVAGYAAVMDIIFQHYNEIPLSENYICQLHKELLKFSEKDERHRGIYKSQSNQIEAFDQSGNSLGVIFVTASAFETPFRMKNLVEWTNASIAEKKLHPLLICAIFIVEFLAIHPFQDGNGRLSRILTTYLLMNAGYIYVPYSSLEAVIENSKDAYYLALRNTQITLQEEEPNWQPWLLFFLQALDQQKKKLELKISQEKLLMAKLPPLSLSILSIIKSRGHSSIAELVTLTEANRNTLKKHLEHLVKSNHISKIGQGKNTAYILN
ncbi:MULTISPECIES: Fic family protein [unclassified Sphingobacterium]|uniref:Fic family protein n=1 Tax=unclassified Sphingobacterium TaxID=2609468 RepID=UPI0025FD23D8|nr:MULTISPECIES: Fic family protein [unclassified Sphingobacterium]